MYLGGWWLFALALVGGLIALHELYTMARELRPLVIAGYLGFVLALVGLQLGGVAWMVGGMLTTLFFSFVVFGLSDVRPSATASFGVTLLGVVWVGGGIGFLLLVRDIPDHGFWAVMAVLFTVFAADTAAFFVGRALGRHRMAPAISPAEDVGGVRRRRRRGDDRRLRHPLQRPGRVPDDPRRCCCSGPSVALAAVFGDLFESAVKRDLEVKDSGRLLGGHGGMLDRLDALLWAGPAAYYVILAVGGA